ncbi:MAG: hypothetical protein L3K18_09510 [Thermoplasmata archaeon]|nr:hypothetical protein [Thermoplasmata archaeon]
MSTPAAALGGLESGSKAAAMELIDVIFDWIVPILTLIVGYVTSSGIGLSGALGTVIDGALGATGIPSNVMAYIADLIAILIWGCIGAGLWASRGKAGEWGGYVLKPLATLFFGFAIGEAPNLIAGKVSNGALGKAVNTLEA